MTWLLTNQKTMLILAGILALLLAGGYAKGVYDEAGQAGVLRQQIKATMTRIDEQNAAAKAAEAQMETDRAALATLTKKWNAARAQTNRTACRLDDIAIGVLKAATAHDAPAR